MHHRILWILALISIISAQLVVTEVMRNPEGNETALPGGLSGEYIEIFNLGDSVINLEGAVLFDGDIVDSLRLLSPGSISEGSQEHSFLLAPGEIAVILDPDIFPIYDSFPLNLPPDTRTFTVNHRSICGGLASEDGFIILRGNDTLAAFADSGYITGEKIYCQASAPEADGFSATRSSILTDDPCLLSQKASPGEITGLSHKLLREYHITRSSTQFHGEILWNSFAQTAQLHSPEKIKLSQKQGKQLFTMPCTSQIIFHWQIDGLDVLDTVSTSDLWISPQSIIISEASSRQKYDWIELRSLAQTPLLLRNYYFLIGEDSVAIPEFTLQAKETMCLTEIAPNWPIKTIHCPDWRKINHYRDTIILCAPFAHIDTLAWDKDIFSDTDDSSSVQRKDPFISGSQKDNVIAAKPNPGSGINFAQHSQQFNLDVYPEYFSPNDDGDRDSLFIVAHKPKQGNIRIEIYGMNGFLLHSIESNNETRFSWDGRNSRGNKAETGPVFVIGFFTSGDTETKVRKQAVVW